MIWLPKLLPPDFTGSFHKRRLFLLSVLPPLLNETPFAAESEISGLKWRVGRGA